MTVCDAPIIGFHLNRFCWSDFTSDNITYFEDRKRNSRTTLTHACLDESPAVLGETGKIPKRAKGNSGTLDFLQSPAAHSIPLIIITILFLSLQSSSYTIIEER